MRTLLYLVAILIVISNAQSQDLHQPPAMTFSQPQLLVHTPQDRFLYSWNWENAPKALNHRYHNNAYHTLETFNNGWSFPRNSNLTFLLMPDSIDYLWKPWQIHGSYEPLDAKSIMWYPWLPSSSTDDNFTTFRNDHTGASLPFLERNTAIGALDSTVGSEVVYRWRLNRDTASPAPVAAFSKPWLGNEFVYVDGDIGEKSESPFTNFPSGWLFPTDRQHLPLKCTAHP